MEKGRENCILLDAGSHSFDWRTCHRCFDLLSNADANRTALRMSFVDRRRIRCPCKNEDQTYILRKNELGRILDKKRIPQVKMH
jgi:hypothetical protein